MEKFISDYVLTALEVILACALLGSFITIYTVCNLSSSAYQNDVEARSQQELYALYAKYDEKMITDTEVLSLLAKGVNLPSGIALYSNASTSNSFLKIGCNDTVNIGDSNILADLRQDISAGSKWHSYLKTDNYNGEITHIEIRKVQ